MKIKFLFAVLLIGTASFAQQAVHETYAWEGKPSLHNIPTAFNEYPAVYVLHNRFQELRFEFAADPAMFFTEHKIIHINTAAGIERLNKVYIPMHGGKTLESLEVRSIDPAGKVTSLKKENLKELVNVDGYGNFKIFAIEGLAVGGEMEYVYTTKSSPRPYGQEAFQDELPVIEANFELIYPKRFDFAAKSYNGLSKVKYQSLDEKRTSVSVSAKNIPALAEEEYASHRASVMRVEYKMESNGSTTNIITWDKLSMRVLEGLYESSGTARAKKFLKPIDADKLTELEKVRAVEKYIKTNFTLKESGNDAYEDIKDVIANRVGNERGMIKLYMSCWQALDLKPQVVFCSSRFTGKLDPEFASPAFINDVLFYFPALDKYLTPGLSHKRLGAAPENIAGSKALFVDFHFSNAFLKYDGYTVGDIKPLDYTHNHVGVKALVTFNDGFELPLVTQENFWQGHRAADYRAFYFYAPDAKKDEVIKGVTLSGIDNANVLKRELEGQDIELSFDADKYFKVKTTYTASSIIEQAGEDYLVALGKLIGKQSELYQEKQRQMDIEFHGISNYNHEIVMEIPAGYTCTGLESIRISNEVMGEKEPVMKFVSDYKLEGNRLTITVNEVYKTLSLPKTKYEAFRKVINSAADFNKLVLVLHPDAK